jgi:hypothetical protein
LGAVVDGEIRPLAGDMKRFFPLPGAQRRDPEVEAWFLAREGRLGNIAKHWFDIVRGCGDDVCEILHDGHPTACVGEAAFAYVNTFSEHVNVGFFNGSELSDPDGLLEGSGKFMRHVKIRPEAGFEPEALERLIRSAYLDTKNAVEFET